MAGKAVRKTTPTSDVSILRELTQRYVEICHKPVGQERRALWRRKNSLKPCRPLIYVRAYAFREMPGGQCHCQDPFFRRQEDFLRWMLIQDTFADDFIFEPWLTVQARYVTPPDGLWGLPITWIGREAGRAGIWDPPIKEEADAARMAEIHHVIDEAGTAEDVGRCQDAVGDLIAINVDRAGAYRMWNADISTLIFQLRGMEQIMLDMTDRPAWLHGVLAFMRDGILRAHDEADRAGDWDLSAHQNQAMPYALELDDPAANAPAPRGRLWTFCASQETTLVGPEMFNEFMLQYQVPIVSRFALTAYGCCEDLTRKVRFLRQIPNLRRIAVTPFADVARCAEQIGTDYVISYRPSPADMVSYGFNPDRIRSILRRDFAAMEGLHFDITLKDVETVQGDPHRVANLVKITREVIDETWRE